MTRQNTQPPAASPPGLGTPPATFLELERHDFVAADGRHLFVYGELRGVPDATRPESEPVALHKRLDLLTATWIAVSPSRNVRPHSGVAVDADGGPAVCPLCPGGPEVPFSYDAAVFDNRFPALVGDPPTVSDDPRVGPAQGQCEVVLYTERHEGSLATLSPMELARVVAVWRDRSVELWADPRNSFVMAFENSGEAVGATLSHPHGQIYAFDHLPPLIASRASALRRYRGAERTCLACHVVSTDDASDRIVAGNPSFSIAVPFAARWPFELHVRARRHGLGRLGDLTPDEHCDLAAALRQVVARYRQVFDFALPYMMVALEAPPGQPDWHLAFEFYPPHRSARLTKVRASVETATGLFINDTLPEASAHRLAALAGPAVEETTPFTVVHASRSRLAPS
jgi:UDPglucose--hexose-1-phosphate uridylyltransferase